MSRINVLCVINVKRVAFYVMRCVSGEIRVRFLSATIRVYPCYPWFINVLCVMFYVLCYGPLFEIRVIRGSLYALRD